MEATDFASVLKGQIRKQMNEYADDLANGICKDFGEYQKLCGVIRGLAIAEDYLLTALKKVDETDE